jgi:hypothetical protein
VLLIVISLKQNEVSVGTSAAALTSALIESVIAHHLLSTSSLPTGSEPVVINSTADSTKRSMMESLADDMQEQKKRLKLDNEDL